MGGMQGMLGQEAEVLREMSRGCWEVGRRQVPQVRGVAPKKKQRVEVVVPH